LFSKSEQVINGSISLIMRIESGREAARWSRKHILSAKLGGLEHVVKPLGVFLLLFLICKIGITITTHL
jgi:hypothetical protein